MTLMLPRFTLVSDTILDGKQSENPIGNYKKVLFYLHIEIVFKIVYFGFLLS